MKKTITYTEEQVLQMKYMLNGITVIGIQNAKQVAAIAQVLESGMPGEIKGDDELKNVYPAEIWKTLPKERTSVGKGSKKEGEG